jgi:hypothetical protein
MNRRHILGLSATTALVLAVLPGSAIAQQKPLKDQLVGAWTLVSNDNTLPDGSRRQLWGPNPKGILILDASGHYAQTQMRADRQKLKSANRLEATPEESRAAMRETLAQFGTWFVDEASKTITLRIEGSVFPNSENGESKRLITTLTADELKVANPGPSAGGRSEAVFRRSK